MQCRALIFYFGKIYTKLVHEVCSIVSRCFPTPPQYLKKCQANQTTESPSYPAPGGGVIALLTGGASGPRSGQASICPCDHHDISHFKIVMQA